MSIEKAKATIEQQLNHLNEYVSTLEQERDQLRNKLDVVQVRYEI
jgi:flagellar biosynthesis chaperone FliJ